MNHIPGFLKIAALLVATATNALGQATPAQLQERAEEALIAGDADRTVALAEQLLQEAPDSYTAHMLLALALSDLGQDRAAAQSARRAYRVAATESDKLQAARLAGTARFEAGQFSQSELWLRRAINHVQTEDEAGRVLLAFREAQAANRLSMGFNASAAPTDNVNDGSSTGIICLEGQNNECVLELSQSEDRLPLSGIEFSGSAQFEYRLSQSSNQTTTLSTLLFGQAYRLSSDAKDLLASSSSEQVRGVTASDFATFVAQVSLAQRQTNFSPFGPTRVAVNLGKFWRGGEPLVAYQDLILSQQIPLNPDASLSFGASVRNQDAISSFLADSDIYEITAGYGTKRSNDDTLRLTFAVKHSASGSENTFNEYRTGINYTFDQTVFNTRWSSSFEVGYRTYEEFSFTFDGRRDRFATMGADVVFESVSYFGFSPSMSFEVSRTDSDVVSAISSEVQARFGISSNF